MKTFAIGDLHGRLDLMVKAIDLISAYSPEGGKIVTLGDYTDRGPESAQLIDLFMHMKETQKMMPDKWEFVHLQGNHEVLFIDWYKYRISTDDFMVNGGMATLRSYGLQPGDVADRGVVPIAHINFLNDLPLYHEDEHRFYVHAYLDDNLELDEHTSDDMLWTVWPEGHAGGYRGKYVVHGHERLMNGPTDYGMRVNIDTSAYKTGRLVVAVFDDDVPGKPVDYIEVVIREKLPTAVSVVAASKH